MYGIRVIPLRVAGRDLAMILKHAGYTDWQHYERGTWSLPYKDMLGYIQKAVASIEAVLRPHLPPKSIAFR